MQAPAFWTLDRPVTAARLMQPLGYLYSLAAELRYAAIRPSRPLAPVVCVGNPTLGGAGKTPVAITIGRRLTARGLKPGFLTRGYGANIATPQMVTGEASAERFGDEPPLLARAGVTVCSPNRPWGADVLADAGVDVIVMDDGFQNPTLRKDLSLLVIDGAVGIGNGLVFPAGPLRMRLSPQLKRADALVIVGAGDAGDRVARMGERRGLPVIRARLTPDACVLAQLSGEPVVAYAGIGRPGKFVDTLNEAGIAVGEAVGYPDHHPYSASDARHLLGLARSHKARLATTEKDLARLAGSTDPALAELAANSIALPVEATFDRVAAHKLDLLLDTIPGAQRRKGKTGS